MKIRLIVAGDGPVLHNRLREAAARNGWDTDPFVRLVIIPHLATTPDGRPDFSKEQKFLDIEIDDELGVTSTVHHANDL